MSQNSRIIEEVARANKKARTSTRNLEQGQQMAKEFFRYQGQHGGDPNKTAAEVIKYYKPDFRR